MTNCKNCGKETSNPKFCNKECFHNWCKNKSYEDRFGKEKTEKIKSLLRVLSKTKEKKVFICKNCKKEIHWSPVGNRSFCSNKCHYEWKLGKTYEEYLGNKGKADNYKKHVSIATTKTWLKPKRSFCRHEKLYGSFESEKHKKIKENISNFLKSKGYETYFEVPVWLGYYFRVVDVLGIKGQEKVAVECGGVNKRKLKEYTDVFQWIVHIPYKGKISYIGGLIY